MAAPVSKGRMFREVSVPATSSSRWKAITICTGASASTLQDIKVPESCGGYSYIDSGSAGSAVRNRFIYWRTHHDVLELVEESLDMSLSGNMVRYKFQDTPVLPKVTVQEAHGNVVILVATVASVHRLVFPHPSKLNRPSAFVLSEQNASSIFYDATLPDDPKNQFLLTPGGSITSHFSVGASCVCSDGHAIFALSNSTGGILLIKMPPLGITGVIIQQELSCSSVMKKLWNGLIPGVMRGSQPVGETAVSIELLTIAGDIYIFTVCRDFRLRVWSTKTKDCVLVENLLDYTSEEFEETGTTPIVNASGHVIKVIEGTTGICVYLCLQNKSRFVFLDPVLDKNRVIVQHLTTLDKSPPQEDLVDFVATRDYLMSLWTTQAGETQVLTTPIDDVEESLSSEWEPVLLSTPHDFVVVPQHRDPRDVYLEKMFSPGFFSPQDIVKALSVYRRCAAPSVEMETLFNMAALKDDVTNAVDLEIRNNATDNELGEEEYTQLQREQWEKFYSCCCQYKQVGEKVKGLFADPVTGLFAVIKKSTFSVLRPCDPTEELYLSPTIRISQSTLDKHELPREGVPVAQFIEDMRLVCTAVQVISCEIPAEDAYMFQCCLQSLDPPDTLIENLRDILRNDQSVINSITELLKQTSNPVVAIEALFDILELTDDLENDMMEGVDQPSHQHYSHLFSGALGTAVLTQSFQQLALLRFQFVRDLTVLMAIAANLMEESGLTQSMKDAIMNELLPKGAYLLRCFKVLVWASEALSTVSPNNTLDFNLRQLSSLKITDNSEPRSLTRPTTQSSYVIQMFLEGVGGELIRRRLSSYSTSLTGIWRGDLNGFLISLSLLIWPATDDTIFPEFLARTCQYLRLQEYVHILSPWCTWNEGSRAFFMGLSYLHFDEPHKAVNMFVDASDGVATEAFLSHKLLQTEEVDHYKLQILYYLKIINLLEEHGLPDLVITMATEAINKADTEDPNLSTLQYKVFKQHLELGHNQEAFAAMMNNPDTDRLKKDSLRKFLVVLCERGNLADLVALDYQDLEEEVVYILENHARSVDLFTYDYYSLLFSYFIYREDYRKAGRIMFERGLRLAHEVPGLKSLQQQAQCYLSALNTLRLVKPEYAWIVKPVFKGDEDQSNAMRVPKHDSEGRNIDRKRGSKKMEILELADLEKDYLLLDARLRLIRSQPDSALITGPMPSKEEMVSLLCAAGLYDLAVSVTRAFSLSPEPILSSLSLRCVTLAISSSYTKTNSDANALAWLWLRENNIPPCGAKDNTAADQAWSLLQSYLTLLEDGSGVCHKCVAHTLLSQSFHLPTWLIHSYKKVDVAALLRVYLNFDLLNQAASLAIEYLDVVTNLLRGIDGPAFNLRGIDKPSPMSVWVPYTCLDQLMVALQENYNPLYSSAYNDLKQRLATYQDKALEISQSIAAC
ncbi:nuclear pore complex protein Nup160-like [Physella acuta]|uniref:nuclear pore complex protein Nup160-like n=1 Tax=Physella acuta TaxID=109671 RepID=UPI0027DC91DF|nr:nuclear pore complex protein Nup160-like [Physella acuta]